MTTTTTYPSGGNVPVSGSNRYGNGTSSASSGANTVIHFYDRAGVKAPNRVNIYAQFSDRKSMPEKMGKTFKISKFFSLKLFFNLFFDQLTLQLLFLHFLNVVELEVFELILNFIGVLHLFVILFF